MNGGVILGTRSEAAVGVGGTYQGHTLIHTRLWWSPVVPYKGVFTWGSICVLTLSLPKCHVVIDMKYPLSCFCGPGNPLTRKGEIDIIKMRACKFGHVLRLF